MARRKLQVKPGVCFACGCTDDFGCDVGCSWTDSLRTMCSECERRARAWLAWFKVVGIKAPRAAKAVQ